MRIVRQVANFESLTVAKRTARITHLERVQVYELDDDNNELRHYEVPFTSVSDPVNAAPLARALRKCRYQEFVVLTPTGTL
jgi:hypothetical protein